jgi:hypothetical protein
MSSFPIQSWVAHITIATFTFFLAFTLSVSAQQTQKDDSQESLTLEWFILDEKGQSTWVDETPYSEKILDKAIEDALALSFAGCSNGEIRTAQAACRDWYGSHSRGVHFCSREPDGYTYFACAVTY